VKLLLALAALAVVLPSQAVFLLKVESRSGVVLPDPLLAALTPRDLSWLTFGIIYSVLAWGLGTLLWHPRDLAVGVEAYVLLVLARMAVMSVTPFDPPAGMIPLVDPIAQGAARGTVLTRDLFFSGHTSLLFLVFLTVPVGRATKAALFGCTVVVASCVLWQHVHYTVDVLSAPAFAAASHSLARLTGRRRSVS
jgi:hypothetical protein